jgi:hypothetical protein
MVNPTYKHLEASLRLGAFTVAQWAQIATAAAAAALFSLYLSPFSTSITMFVAIVGTGLPLALSYGAMGRDFSLGELAVAAWRYWRFPGRYLAGAGPHAAGYLVRAQLTEPEPTAATPTAAADLEETLWDV